MSMSRLSVMPVQSCSVVCVCLSVCVQGGGPRSASPKRMAGRPPRVSDTTQRQGRTGKHRHWKRRSRIIRSHVRRCPIACSCNAPSPKPTAKKCGRAARFLFVFNSHTLHVSRTNVLLYANETIWSSSKAKARLAFLALVCIVGVGGGRSIEARGGTVASHTSHAWPVTTKRATNTQFEKRE
jgi:hypothetical protein